MNDTLTADRRRGRLKAMIEKIYSDYAPKGQRPSTAENCVRKSCAVIGP